MKTIRRLLHSILGTRNYVAFVSTAYMIMVRAGFLKKKFPEIFYLQQLIKKGDTCVDIGANVGYYSWFMRKACGHKGELYAVEPVGMFADIWQKRMKGFSNARLFNYALGAKNQMITMGTPNINGVVHHGMTHVIEKEESHNVSTHKAEMRIPDELFQDLMRIDFLKIDVEGYEWQVFDNMRKTLEKTRPLIQAELSGTENRKNVIDYLESLKYNTYILEQTILIPAGKQHREKGTKDFYFIPQEKDTD